MKIRVFILSFVFLALGGIAQSCPVCGPGAGQQASDAASNAILFLLGVIILVMGGIASFVISIGLRSRRNSQIVFPTSNT